MKPHPTKLSDYGLLVVATLILVALYIDYMAEKPYVDTGIMINLEAQ